MESGLNPFSPNAGSRPPELVGRDDVLNDARTMLQRLPRRLSVQSMLLTGIRGVGKTVLLNEVARIAEAGNGVYPIYLEATEDRGLAEMEGPEYRLQEVADRMKMNVRALSPRRSSLIGKGMIYSPRTGTVAFTVPLFAEYLKRSGVR